jgi:hypothetical protein
MTYAAESRELDTEILRVIDAWHTHGRPLEDAEFNDLALRLFAHQTRYNAAYARYAAGYGYSPAAQPRSWTKIPAVPAAAFREAPLATFDPARAALTFETSGTTSGIAGKHFMETRTLYDAALLATFDRFMLHDRARLRYLNLVPNPAERPTSSLGYMMAQVSALRGDGQTGWYVRAGELLFDALVADLRAALADAQPVCIAATAFALLHVLDEMQRRSLFLALPPGSRIMETGGFKGRTRNVDRDRLYASCCERFDIPARAIVSEYGMTELTSQYYDDVSGHADSAPARRQKLAPPWLRARVVGPDGMTLPNGTVGSLTHVDLANRASCVAISTEDLGVRFDSTPGYGQAGFVLIGREGATLRGCSLDAETLRPR